MKAFGVLSILKREEKPRDVGLTMVLDKGLGHNAARDLMVAADYIDIIKFGWGTPMLYSEEALKEKIRVYKDHGILVSNGGTLLEIAYNEDKTDEFLECTHKMDFDLIEISDGSIDIKRPERKRLIEKALNMGFKVFTEVGKKEPKEDAKITIEERIDIARSDLDAGSDRVIIEAREGGRSIGIYDDEGDVKEKMARRLVDEIGLDKILFEAPDKSQQVYLILNFGRDVNLGNIKPEDVIPLETLRRGLRGDTFGRL
jgi:phosphosulfolactate synthase